MLAAAAATTLMVLVGYASTHLGWDSLANSVVISDPQLANAAFSAFAETHDLRTIPSPLPPVPRRLPYPMPATAFGLDAAAHALASDRCLDRRAVLLAEPGTSRPACGCLIDHFEGCGGAGCGGPRDPTVPAAAVLEPGCADWLCQCQGISNRFASDRGHSGIIRDRHVIIRDRHDRFQRPIAATLLRRVREWWDTHGCTTTAAHADPQAIHIFDPVRCPDCGCYPRHRRGDVAAGLVFREALHRFLPPVPRPTVEAGSRYFGVAPGEVDDVETAFFFRVVRDIARSRGYVSWLAHPPAPEAAPGGGAPETTRGPQLAPQNNALVRLAAIGCQTHTTRPAWVTAADTVVWKIDLKTARDPAQWAPCRATAWALLKARYAIQMLTASHVLGPTFAPNTRVVSEAAMPALLELMAEKGATVLLYATKSLDHAIPWRSVHLSSYEYNDVNGLPLRFAPLGSFFNSSVPFWPKTTAITKIGEHKSGLGAGAAASNSEGNSISGSEAGLVEDTDLDASLVRRAKLSQLIYGSRTKLSKLRSSHSPRTQPVWDATARLAYLLVWSGSDADITEAAQLYGEMVRIQTGVLGHNHTQTLVTAVAWAAAIVANKNVRNDKVRKSMMDVMRRKIGTLRAQLGHRDPKVLNAERILRRATAPATVLTETDAQTARKPVTPPPDLDTPMSLLVISLKSVSKEHFYATMPLTAALFAAQTSDNGGEYSGALRRSLYPSNDDLAPDSQRTQGSGSSDGGAPRKRPRLFPSNRLLNRLAANGYGTLSTADSCNMDFNRLASTAQHGHELVSYFCRIQDWAKGIPVRDRSATTMVFARRFVNRQKYPLRYKWKGGVRVGVVTQKGSVSPWAMFLHLSAGDEDSMVASAAMDLPVSEMIKGLQRSWHGKFSAVIMSDGGLDRGDPPPPFRPPTRPLLSLFGLRPGPLTLPPPPMPPHRLDFWQCAKAGHLPAAVTRHHHHLPGLFVWVFGPIVFWGGSASITLSRNKRSHAYTYRCILSDLDRAAGIEIALVLADARTRRGRV